MYSFCLYRYVSNILLIIIINFHLEVGSFTDSLIKFHSAVPPAYYAHLAAFRARFYMEPETSDSGSMTSGAAGGRGPGGPPGGGGGGVRSTRAAGSNINVKPLPSLKENVKRVMFYC